MSPIDIYPQKSQIELFPSATYHSTFISNNYHLSPSGPIKRT